MLYWAQLGNALQIGAWWWYVPPGLAVALLGTALVLLNTGIDELSNPRLRDARSATKIAGHRVWLTDPTPILGASNRRSGVAGLVRAFGRRSPIEAPHVAVPAGNAEKAGDLS
jgi:hypothetical protein